MNKVFMNTEVYQELPKISPDLARNQVTQIVAMIREREIMEISARDEDIPLQGLFTFLKNMLAKFPDIRESFAEKNSLLQFLIHDCLFHKETRGQMIQKAKAMPPKCKHPTSREKCLELLGEVCTDNSEGV